MANKFRDNKPRGLKPVQRIELSEENAKRRFIVVVALILIGATAIAFGVGSLLSTEPGWQQIEANPKGLSCARDFVFNYYFADEEIFSCIFLQIRSGAGSSGALWAASLWGESSNCLAGVPWLF